MHDLLWEKLRKLDGQETAVRAICAFDGQSSSYTVRLLGEDFRVDVEEQKIQSADDQRDADFLEQLCILAYLIDATDMPKAQKLVSGDKLDAGQFFFRGPHALPTGKLEEAFGDEPDLLYEAGASLGAQRCEYGDASIEVRVLPRFPIVFVVWGRDEEFEARGSILFDETADKHLPLDAIGAAVQLALGKILKKVG